MSMKDTVESAMKSLELEGFEFTDEEKAVLEELANEKITTREALEIFKRIP